RFRSAQPLVVVLRGNVPAVEGVSGTLRNSSSVVQDQGEFEGATGICLGLGFIADNLARKVGEEIVRSRSVDRVGGRRLVGTVCPQVPSVRHREPVTVLEDAAKGELAGERCEMRLVKRLGQDE